MFILKIFLILDSTLAINSDCINKICFSISGSIYKGINIRIWLYFIWNITNPFIILIHITKFKVRETLKKKYYLFVWIESFCFLRMESIIFVRLVNRFVSLFSTTYVLLQLVGQINVILVVVILFILIE